MDPLVCECVKTNRVGQIVLLAKRGVFCVQICLRHNPKQITFLNVIKIRHGDIMLYFIVTIGYRFNSVQLKVVIQMSSVRFFRFIRNMSKRKNVKNGP